jgi:hypothetical protein
MILCLAPYKNTDYKYYKHNMYRNQFYRNHLNRNGTGIGCVQESLSQVKQKDDLTSYAKF